MLAWRKLEEQSATIDLAWQGRLDDALAMVRQRRAQLTARRGAPSAGAPEMFLRRLRRESDVPSDVTRAAQDPPTQEVRLSDRRRVMAVVA